MGSALKDFFFHNINILFYFSIKMFYYYHILIFEANQYSNIYKNVNILGRTTEIADFQRKMAFFAPEDPAPWIGYPK